MNKLVDVSEIEKLQAYGFFPDGFGQGNLEKVQPVPDTIDNFYEGEALVSLNDVLALLDRSPEASPPVEVEPVGEVIHSSGHPEWDFASCKELKGKLSIGTKLYTSPPDTEAKLKIAVEALTDAKNYIINNKPERRGMGDIVTYGNLISKLEQVLKDIGEIK